MDTEKNRTAYIRGSGFFVATAGRLFTISARRLPFQFCAGLSPKIRGRRKSSRFIRPAQPPLLLSACNDGGSRFEKGLFFGQKTLSEWCYGQKSAVRCALLKNKTRSPQQRAPAYIYSIESIKSRRMERIFLLPL